MKKQPDYFVSLNVDKTLKSKSHVIHFPINLSQDLIDSILIETQLNQLIEYLNHEAYLSNYKPFINSLIYRSNKLNCKR